MSILRILGDSHGLQKRYYDIVKDCEYSVQLGDFGFNYDILEKLNFENHKVLKGNHDNYDKDGPHFLGDFGPCQLGPHLFFFIRGGFSIDKKFRIEQEKKWGIKSYWEQEELTAEESIEAIQLYNKIKPDFVLSHDVCTDISEKIGRPEILIYFGWNPGLITPTQETLQTMFELHQPKLWVFAHYHYNCTLELNGTKFVGLGELNWVDIDEQLEIVRRG
uniref:Calcineurin-like phosphoesterase n=1 Tax=viral metagenome TaxID=1070528 RepID=A0A6M3JXP5_9ZZZZ